MPLELVLLVPVLMLLTLFVLWAGRGGRAGLTADLAAEEAATAAALCCEEGPNFESDRDALVADILASRPGLQFLCVGGLRPAADPDRGSGAEFVQEHWLEFEPGASSGGVGVLGVRFECETDGAVAPLRGLFPTVTFHGQAAEVVVRRPSPPDIGFESSRFIAVEGLGGRLAFVVTSATPVSDDVVVSYEIVAAGTTATDPGDYTAPPDHSVIGTPTVTITAGDDEAEIVVSLGDDGVYEGTEMLALQLVGLYDSNGQALPGPDAPELDPNRTTAEGWITDDEDQPFLFISPQASPCEVTEGSTTLSFDVRLRDRSNTADAPSAVTVTVDADTASTGAGAGHATAGSDYIAQTGNTVTFNSGDVAKTVTVAILDDAGSPVGEPDETFKVELLDAAGAPLGRVAEATCTILDDEVRVTADAAEADEGGRLKFELMLDRRPAGDIKVGFELVEHRMGADKAVRGTACTGGIDYLRSSGDIVIASGHDPKLKVTSIPEAITCADRVVERSETFWLSITVLSGEAVAPAPGGAVGTIRNDDVPVISVRPLNPQGTEGGTVGLTVTLDDGRGGGLQLTQGVSLGYAVAGRGTSPATDPGSTGADYALERSGAAMPLTGTVAFAAGSSATVQQEVFDVELLADYLAEPSESLRLDLSIQTDPVGEAVFEDRDNDPLTDDSHADVTIIDDPPPALSVSDFSGDEGTDQTFAVTLANRRAGDTVTVDYTVGGGSDTATAPPAALHDYTAAPNYTPTDPLTGTITFSGAKTVHNVGVRLLRDTQYEADETLSITLSNQSSNALLADATGEGTIVDADAPRLVVANVSAQEGLNLTFTVTLCSPVAGEDVSVAYATQARSAAAGLDFTATSGTLAFRDTGLNKDPLDSQVPAGCGTGRTNSKSKTVSVATVRDGIAENDEEIHLLLSSQSPSHIALGKAVGVGTILNRNPAIVRIDNPTANEGDPLNFKITAVDDKGNLAVVTKAVTINYATADRTAASASDYTAVSGTVTFDPYNPPEAGVAVSTSTDTVAEGDETVALLLTLAPSTDNAALGDSEGTGTIVDSPPPYIRIDSPAAVDEGTTVRFTVGLYDANGSLTSSSETVTVNYVTADGTATAGSDYTAVSAGTLTFSPGDQQKTIDVVTLTDSAAEPAETFRVNLSAPVNAILDKAVGVGTINAHLKPGLSVSDATTRAGATAIFTVTLDAASTSTVTVDYATSDGTAAAGSDYTAASGTLTFSPGDTTARVGVLTTRDSDTGDETFQMRLSGATGADLDDDTGVGTIQPVVGSALSIADASGPENAVMKFDVTLSPAAAQTVTVDYATRQRSVPGAATEGSDYQSKSGTLTFAAGDTAKTVDVAIEDDNVNEHDETFLVELSNPSGAAVVDGTAVGTIDGNLACADRRSSSTDKLPTASVTGARADEDDGKMDMTVTVTGAMCQDYTFQFEVKSDTRPGRSSATTDADFRQPKTVTLAAGQTSVGFSALLIDDDVVEGDETFKLRVWSKRLPGLRNLAADVEVHPTIVDDDTAELQLPADGTVLVGEGGWLSFVIRLDQASNTDVTFDYATSDGSSPAAAEGDDYEEASGTATIPAGDLSVTVAVRTLQDTLDEHDENVDLTVSNLSGATADPDGDTAVGVITDDDAAPAVSVGDATAVEGDKLQFEVTLDAPSGRKVTVKRQTHDGSAVAADPHNDYDALTLGTVAIAAGATSQTVEVQTSTDDVVENTESMFLELKNPDGATLDDYVGLGRIIDGTARRMSVSDASVIEGGTLAFRVSIADANYQRDITVRYRTRAGSAVAGVDYSDASEAPLSSELKILAGDTSATVLVPTVQDRLDEAVESLALVLSDPDGAKIVDGTAGGVIVDDDPEPRLRVSDAAASEDDGSVTFTLSLSEASGRDVTVTYRTRDGVGDDAAEAGKDYTAVPAGTKLTIAAGDRQAVVSVALVDDSVAEKVEKFRLEVTAAVNASLDDSVGWATITDDDGLIQILADDAGDVYEGPNAAATFTVRLSRADSARAVTVGYATEDGTAAAGADYTAASGTLTFAAGEVSKTVTVAVTEDDETESAETFRLKLSSPSDNAEQGDDTALALILDADSRPTVSVADAPAVAEGSTASFAVSLSRSSVRAATVAYATRADPTAGAETAAAVGLDYTATSGTLTIPARSTAATVTVPLLDDSFDEHTETFWLRLSSPTGATVLDGTAVGTINDNDPLPKIEILDAGADEGSTLSFDVRLSAVSGRTVSVPWATQALSPGPKAATSGVDYTAAAGTATFAPTATAATVTVASLADNVAEEDEQFLVQLGTPVNAVLDDSAAVGAIVDDDSLPRVSIAGASAHENAGPVVFNVALSEASGQSVTVSYTVADGTAVAGEDYSPGAASTLSIPAGDVRGQISVAMVDDDVGESTETFTVTLSSPVNAVIAGGAGTATGTILDDEGPPRLTIGDADECEDGSSPGDCEVRACRVAGHRTWEPGNRSSDVTYCQQHILTPDACPPGQCRGNGTIEFPVELSHAAATDTSVRYTTFVGEASSPRDYTATTARLTIPAGDTTASIAISLTNDGIDEPPTETFRLVLDDPDGVELDDAAAVGTIRDDDLAPTVPGVSTDAWANENDGHIYHRVTLSRPSGRTVTVDYWFGSVIYYPAAEDLGFGYTLDCATHPGGPGIQFTCAELMDWISDTGCVYPHQPGLRRSCQRGTLFDGGTLTFAPGVVEQVIAVPLTDNAVATSVSGAVYPYSNVSYDLNFSNRVNASRAGNGKGQVWDDETPPYVDSIAAAAEVAESAGEVVFTINLNRVDDEDVVVTYGTVDGTATAGSDYTAADSTVTIPKGAASATVTVAITGDTVVESDETFTLQILDDSRNRNLTYVAVPLLDGQGDGSATVTIIDDDTTPTVSVADVEVNEYVGTARLRVTLDRISAEAVTIDYATADGTATAGADYSAASGTLTVPAASTGASVDVTIIQDAAAESDETFTLGLSSPVGATVADGSATVTIIDDDTTPEVSVADTRAKENQWHMPFWVSLSRASSRDVTVDYATADGTAVANSDYWPISGTLTIPAKSTGAPLTVQLIRDTVSESDETFTLGLSNPVGATIADGSATATITEDATLPTLTVADVSYSENISESGSPTLGLTGLLDGPAPQTVSVDWQVVETPSLGDQSATRGVDFQTVPGFGTMVISQRFGSGYISAASVLSDDVVELDEKFRVVFSNPRGVTLARTEAWVTILNDDLPTVSVADAAVSESGDSVDFALTLDQPGLRAGRIDYTTVVRSSQGDRAAKPGEDYTTASGTVSFAAGVITATVSVPLIGDSADEYDETFLLVLSNPDSLQFIDSVAVGTITDDDDGWWIAEDRSVWEDAGKMTFTVQRDHTSAAAASVSYRIVSGASAVGGASCGTGVDFLWPSGSSAGTGTVTMAPTVQTATLEVTICNDTETEGKENLVLELTGKSSRNPTAIGTIIDND